MTNRHLLVILGLLVVTAAVGATWNAGYEAVPAGTDLASDLDTYINGFKLEVRQRSWEGVSARTQKSFLPSRRSRELLHQACHERA